LEELIRVNTELTESIEELNNGGMNQSGSEEIENKMNMLMNENQKLREMLEQEVEGNRGSKRSNIQNDDQT
jgi:mannose/fructose/N-acetylgalactosamine-specific phosphotransferase system component IIB